MAVTTKKTRTNRLPEPVRLTAEQARVLLEGDYCPKCKKPNILRREWREDFYCGWCRSVFKMIGRALSYIGNQKDLD